MSLPRADPNAHIGEGPNCVNVVGWFDLAAFDDARQIFEGFWFGAELKQPFDQLFFKAAIEHGKCLMQFLLLQEVVIAQSGSCPCQFKGLPRLVDGFATWHL